MINLTFDEFCKASFTLYENNPNLKHPVCSPVIADPSVLTPDESPDGKWHMLCHCFTGVFHYISNDGVAFSKVGKIVNNAMRADIKVVDGKYYLYYEKTRSPLGKVLSSVGLKWKSSIYSMTSADLISWSEEKQVLAHSRSFEKDRHGVSLSNPFLIKKDGKFRLYYSCGQTYIRDCSFCEPKHISYAESSFPDRDFVARRQPVISPDKAHPYLNLCSGCIKVYRLKDCYIGLQNGIYRKDGKSHSAIMLLRSDDGESFEFIKTLIEPKKCGSNSWMAQFVYACSLTYYNGELRIYFNARNAANNLTGKESIGFAYCKV